MLVVTGALIEIAGDPKITPHEPATARTKRIKRARRTLYYRKIVYRKPALLEHEICRPSRRQDQLNPEELWKLKTMLHTSHLVRVNEARKAKDGHQPQLQDQAGLLLLRRMLGPETRSRILLVVYITVALVIGAPSSARKRPPAVHPAEQLEPHATVTLTPVVLPHPIRMLSDIHKAHRIRMD